MQTYLNNIIISTSLVAIIICILLVLGTYFTLYISRSTAIYYLRTISSTFAYYSFRWNNQVRITQRDTP